MARGRLGLPAHVLDREQNLLAVAAHRWAAVGPFAAMTAAHPVAAAFSPDGARVVTASSDETARLWDAGTGAEIAVLGGHVNGVRSAAFSPDGARVVTASMDQRARLWIVFSNTQGLVTYVSETVPRLLTPAQRERFYLSAE